MDIRDIMMEPTGVKRPEHPDFWTLSETVLKLKADVQETKTGSPEQERRWRATYEAIGDFDSIAYAAIQCGFDLFGIKDGSDWQRLQLSSHGQQNYVKVVQAFFDGFALGAALQRKRSAEDWATGDDDS